MSVTILDLDGAHGAGARAELPARVSVGTGGPEPELVVSASVEPAELDRLLELLLAEDCVHSWRNVGPGDHRTPQGLAAWENERRPTQLLFFSVEQGSRARLVAAAAVAERLNHEFPYPGFPVLGRCYVLPEFRGRGFYRRILQFRLEYCAARLGEELRGVHIGTADRRIARSITTSPAPGWPPFVHLGQEELGVAGTGRTVDDYLLIAPGYLHRLRTALSGPDAPACVKDLRSRLSSDGAGTADLGPFVRARFAEACSLGWFDARDSREIEQLLSFCRAIPLIGFG